MADFNIRSESVDVEQIMKQIRARIHEKRGVDYTEEQIRELATVRLEKFLDPKNLRSDLLEQFRRSRPPLPRFRPSRSSCRIRRGAAASSHRISSTTDALRDRIAGRCVSSAGCSAPILKLFFNPNTLIRCCTRRRSSTSTCSSATCGAGRVRAGLTSATFSGLRAQSQVQTASFERSRAEWNVLYYEVLHNLVLETTRNGIEVKNLQHARRGAGQPARLQRAPRPRARRRRAVPAGGGASAARTGLRPTERPERDAIVTGTAASRPAIAIATAGQ